MNSQFSHFTLHNPLTLVTEIEGRLFRHTCIWLPTSGFLGWHLKRFWNWVVLAQIISPWGLLCSSSTGMCINKSLYPLITSWIRTVLVVSHSRKSSREILWASRHTDAICWLLKWVLMSQVMVFSSLPLLAIVTVCFSAVPYKIFHLLDCLLAALISWREKMWAEKTVQKGYQALEWGGGWVTTYEGI